MIKNICTFIGSLWICTTAFANPFAGTEVALKPNQACKYSEVYSLSNKTFLLLNFVESLSFKKDKLKTSPNLQISESIKSVITDCKTNEKIKISEIKFKENKLSFEYGSGRHSIEWLNFNGARYVVYKKLYGTYENEPLMVLKYKNGVKDYTRVTGRYGPEKKSTRYTFFYKGKTSQFSQKIKLENKSYQDIRSLTAIYNNLEIQKPVIKVGVIGTGLDYNHPGVAKYLAHRTEMESDLKDIENLENKLREFPFINENLYKKTSFEFKTLKKKTGFPEWMDQAWGSKTPYDAVIINNRRSSGATVDHETRVTSRILRSGGPVEVHFARRSMGSLDKLNVHEVMKNFVKGGVRLVNLSFGSTCGKLPLEEKMWGEVFALYPEIVFVVSAGNFGLNTLTSPFCPAHFSTLYKNVISVTALGPSGDLAVYYDTPVNFGLNVDLAIKSDNLEVLIPFKRTFKWENNANGATSLAAAEISRILTEAALEGLDWKAQTVKEVFVKTSDYRKTLRGVNKWSSEVNEQRFKEALKIGSTGI